MAHQRLAALLVALITSFGFFVADPAYAGLPQGNAIKDPTAILRDALPFDQEDLRDLQPAWKAPVTIYGPSAGVLSAAPSARPKPC